MAIIETMCELLDVRPDIRLTCDYVPSAFLHPGTIDYREAITPKHPADDPDFTPRPYYQVFASRTGFIPNISILDLLFNMGPEGVFWL